MGARFDAYASAIDFIVDAENAAPRLYVTKVRKLSGDIAQRVQSTLRWPAAQPVRFKHECRVLLGDSEPRAGTCRRLARCPV